MAKKSKKLTAIPIKILLFLFCLDSLSDLNVLDIETLKFKVNGYYTLTLSREIDFFRTR